MFLSDDICYICVVIVHSICIFINIIIICMFL